MRIPCQFILLATLLACAGPSCKKEEDPKLIEKREQQQVEIARLKGELALLEEKLKNVPPDVTAELADITQQTELKAAEVTKLEAEKAGLEARKLALQKEFDAYRAKYPIPKTPTQP